MGASTRLQFVQFISSCCTRLALPHTNAHRAYLMTSTRKSLAPKTDFSNSMKCHSIRHRTPNTEVKIKYFQLKVGRRQHRHAKVSYICDIEARTHSRTSTKSNHEPNTEEAAFPFEWTGTTSWQMTRRWNVQFGSLAITRVFVSPRCIFPQGILFLVDANAAGLGRDIVFLYVRHHQRHREHGWC